MKLEWLKNYSYRPVRVLTTLYFIFIICLLILANVDIEIGPISLKIAGQGIFDFPEIWHTVTYFAAILKILLGLIIIFTITHEFSNRLFKQNIIDGLSRKEFLTSKMLTIIFLSLLSTILVFIVSVILGVIYAEKITVQLFFEEIYFIFGYFLKLVTFFSFFMFLSVLFKRAVFVIISYLIWLITELILSVTVTAVRDYLPFNSMDALIKHPLGIFDIVKDNLNYKYIFEVPTLAVIVCLAYICLFTYASYYLLKKRDC